MSAYTYDQKEELPLESPFSKSGTQLPYIKTTIIPYDMPGISGIPYIFAKEKMETSCVVPDDTIDMEEPEEAEDAKKPSGRILKLLYPERKKWTKSENKIFDKCFTSLLCQFKDPKNIRPKMLLEKLQKYGIDVSREQVASRLQKSRL
jgi:hypothetical protein